MPAFLVEAPSVTGRTLPEGATHMVVFADTAADAKDIAKAQFGGDSNALWAAATATELTAAADMKLFQLAVNILDSTPVVAKLVSVNLVIGVITVAVNGAGTGYAVGEVLTLTPGTSTSPARFEVVAETAGVIDTLKLIDPGQYSVTPGTTALATTGGGNGDATVDVTEATDTLDVIAGAAVEALQAEAIIAGAQFDPATRILTIAEGGGVDDLGDKKVECEVRFNGVAIGGFVTAITDEGVSTADLDATLAAASLAVPRVLKTGK